jgi:glyoxylase-like metal-dependent hydrolase (beta-lactamase superfamily II)
MKRLWWVLGAMLALGVLLVVFARTMQHRYHAPAARVAGGEVMHARAFFSDLYGVHAGGKVLLFDAGVDDEGGALDQLLLALEAKREDVSDVYLTHGHFDHVAAAPLCTQARIHVGAPDAAMAEQKVPMLAPWPGKLLNALMPIGPVVPSDRMPAAQARFTHGADQVIALPTPGHTPGSFVYLFRDVLFSGDSILIDGAELAFAMPAFSLDPAANRRSIAALGVALKELLGGRPLKAVCTGHMGCTPPGEAQRMFDALVARAGS